MRLTSRHGRRSLVSPFSMSTSSSSSSSSYTSSSSSSSTSLILLSSSLPLLLLSLLLLLPAPVACVVVSESPSSSSLLSDSQAAASVEDALRDGDAAAAASAIAVPPQARPAVGTKYAPVDGQDGKPHMGAFVEVSSSSSGRAGGAAADGDNPGSSEGDGSSSSAAAAADINAAEPTSLKRLSEEMAATDGSADGLKVPIPESNDGVMDDKDRVGPKQGTTGTEGGVSGKSMSSLEAKVPYAPKEAPGSADRRKETKVVEAAGEGEGVGVVSGELGKGIGGLEKPTDLPGKPHDIPHPAPPTMPEDVDDLDAGQKGSIDSPSPPTKDSDDGMIQPFHSFILSVTMILFSEIGDKTFLVAALMAMRHDRLLVFSAAFIALIAMTVLSAVLGHAVPTLISKRFTNFLAALLFLVFGLRLLREGYGMSPDEGVGEEMKEVEMELEEKEHLARKSGGMNGIGSGRRRSSVSPYTLEAGRGRQSRSKQRFPVPPRSPSSSPSRSPSPGRSSLKNVLVGFNNLCSLLLSPAWVQTFVMTFLGEWGDRSQIATIAMAAGQDYWWVTGGAITGHAVCTAAAVLGGRAVAGRVSMRVVTLGGAFAFLGFGIIYLIEAAYTE